jgi:hypothetical protein
VPTYRTGRWLTALIKDVKLAVKNGPYAIA